MHTYEHELYLEVGWKKDQVAEFLQASKISFQTIRIKQQHRQTTHTKRQQSQNKQSATDWDRTTYCVYISREMSECVWFNVPLDA